MDKKHLLLYYNAWELGSKNKGCFDMTVRHPFERIASAYRDKFSQVSIAKLEDGANIENK
jgi:hypothetical protein